MRIETQKKLIWVPIAQWVIIFYTVIIMFKEFIKKRMSIIDVIKFNFFIQVISSIISGVFSLITHFVTISIVELLLGLLKTYLVYLVQSYFCVDLQEELSRK